MQGLQLFIIGVAMAVATVGQAWATSPAPAEWLRPAKVPYPADNAPTPARVELGRLLFFDPRLSGNGMMSCASCHNPSLGWVDRVPVALGNQGRPLARNTPTLVNTAYNSLQMWDGRKRTLEEQALGPFESSDEMNLPADQLVKRLQSIAGYRAYFDKAYPGEGITPQTIGKAIASYERTIVSGEAPFDRWIKGDARAISPAAQRGFAVFKGKGNCALCHMGFNFTDNGFHNIGVLSRGDGEDLGRFAHRRLPSMKGAFKTPTLRDVALTPPYMRNGIYATLEEVVDHYDRGGDSKDNLSPNIKPLNLTPQEKQDLVEFMKSLTGRQIKVVLPVLPN